MSHKDEAREAVYMVVAAHEMLTVMPSEHGAKVPGHWAKYVDELIEAAEPFIRADERRKVEDVIGSRHYESGYSQGWEDACAERDGE